MRRYATVAAACFAFIASGHAQTPTPAIVVRAAKDLSAYAISFPKPEYSYELRSRRVGGTGVFLLHIRPDGTDQYVETLKTTGHVELDNTDTSVFHQRQLRPRHNTAMIIHTINPHHTGTSNS